MKKITIESEIKSKSNSITTHHVLSCYLLAHNFIYEIEIRMFEYY
jgi:hypothetical protein